MFNVIKNKHYFLSLCESLIEQYETSVVKPSAKTIMIEAIKRNISLDPNSNAFFVKRDQNNYEASANSLLCNISFDFLASGKFHLYYGVLNPMSEADNLMAIYKGSMNWALKNGRVNETEIAEQFNYLLKRISQVG